MSEDPVRLVDDPKAPAELRADLGRAADAPPPAFELDRGLARLSAAIGALPGGGGPASPGGSAGGGAIKGGAAIASKGGVLGSGVFWGVTAAGLVGALIVLAPAVVSHPATVSPPVATAAPTAALSAAPSATADALADNGPPTRDEAPTAPSPTAAEVPSNTAPADAAPHHGSRAASSAPAEPLARPSDADEMRDLAALRVAQGDPARALELANTGARRFPAGIFAIEREAIAITALARLGRAGEARARAEAFLAAHPKSVYAEQVRRAGNL